MDLIGDILEFILQLGWSLLLLFLVAAIAFFIFVNLLKLTIWALILGGVTWLIFDSFWIGFVIGIILTIWVIKDMGFAEFIDPSESTSKDKTVYEDTEMPIPYHGGGGGGSTSSVGRSNYGSTPYVPSYERNRRENRMDDLSSELYEMEYNLNEAKFISSEAEDAVKNSWNIKENQRRLWKKLKWRKEQRRIIWKWQNVLVISRIEHGQGNVIIHVIRI